MTMFYLLQETATTSPGLVDILVKSNLLNFLIAFGFLAWVFKKYNVLSALDRQQAKITHELQDAETRKNKALAELQEIERRSAALTAEVDALLVNARQTAESVADGVIKNAEAEAEAILEAGRKRLIMDQKMAARDLEARLMREAIYSARQLLENTLTPDDKQRSIADFIETLPDLVQKESR